MDKIAATVFAVMDEFERKHGRGPNTRAEFEQIKTDSKMLDDLGPVEPFEPEPEPDWNEA